MQRAADCRYWLGHWFQTLVSPNTSVNASLKEALFTFIEKNCMWSNWPLIWQWMVMVSIVMALVQAKFRGFTHLRWHHDMLKPLLVPGQRLAKRAANSTSRVIFPLENTKILAESCLIYRWQTRADMAANVSLIGLGSNAYYCTHYLHRTMNAECRRPNLQQIRIFYR